MYQGLWINGKLVKKGPRECSNRYYAIKTQLETLNSPFTVLDIGADNGYFSFRITEDFNATATMIEENKRINKALTQNTTNNNVTLINKRITVDELKELASREHFDVVLALSVIHHFEDYNRAIETIFELGDYIFIEPSALAEEKGGYMASRVRDIWNNLNERNPKILTQTKNLRKLGMRPLMFFDQTNDQPSQTHETHESHESLESHVNLETHETHEIFESYEFHGTNTNETKRNSFLASFFSFFKKA